MCVRSLLIEGYSAGVVQLKALQRVYGLYLFCSDKTANVVTNLLFFMVEWQMKLSLRLTVYEL